MKRLILVLCVFLSKITFAQFGGLDNTFGQSGFVVLDAGSDYDWARNIAVQPDGKILVLGQSDFLTTDIVVFRLNSDGTLDNSFDGDGKVVLDLNNSQDQAMAIKLQPDGKILICGKTVFLGVESPTEDVFLLRLNFNGSIDLSFNQQGFVGVDLNNLNNFAYNMLLQPDGKILLMGMGYNLNSTFIEGEAFRYMPDGSIDSTFDDDGKFSMPQNIGEETTFRGAVYTNDQKIILGGRKKTNSLYDIIFVRLNDDGTIDNTFDSDGSYILDLGSFDEELTGIYLNEDGKITASGRYVEPGLSKTVGFVAKILQSPELDTSFGNNGKTIFSSVETMYDITGLAVAANGNIYLVANSQNASLVYSYQFFGFNSDGMPLSNFGNNGQIIHSYEGQTITTGGIALQSDGKIVSCGVLSTGLFGSPANFIVVRLLNEIPSSVFENQANIDLLLYPNPANERLFIRMKEKFCNIEITDIRGNIIMKSTVEPTTGIDISNLAKGCYFVSLQENQKIIKRKLIKL